MASTNLPSPASVPALLAGGGFGSGGGGPFHHGSGPGGARARVHAASPVSSGTGRGTGPPGRNSGTTLPSGSSSSGSGTSCMSASELAYILLKSGRDRRGHRSAMVTGAFAPLCQLCHAPRLGLGPRDLTKECNLDSRLTLMRFEVF